MPAVSVSGQLQCERRAKRDLWNVVSACWCLAF